MIPFVTADALLAHAIGDYLLQSHWMATEKVKRSVAAAAHALCYTLPFLLLTRDMRALAFIVGTHFVIDRWRLARYVVWAKNFLAPRRYIAESTLTAENPPLRRNAPWSECKGTGYPRLAEATGPTVAPGENPVWLTVWLLIIADNVLHVCMNGLALRWWG